MHPPGHSIIPTPASLNASMTSLRIPFVFGMVELVPTKMPPFQFLPSRSISKPKMPLLTTSCAVSALTVSVSRACWSRCRCRRSHGSAARAGRPRGAARAGAARGPGGTGAAAAPCRGGRPTAPRRRYCRACRPSPVVPAEPVAPAPVGCPRAGRPGARPSRQSCPLPRILAAPVALATAALTSPPLPSSPRRQSSPPHRTRRLPFRFHRRRRRRVNTHNRTRRAWRAGRTTTKES